MIMDKNIHFVTMSFDGKEVKTFIDGYLRSAETGCTWVIPKKSKPKKKSA